MKLGGKFTLADRLARDSAVFVDCSYLIIRRRPLNEWLGVEIAPVTVSADEIRHAYHFAFVLRLQAKLLGAAVPLLACQRALCRYRGLSLSGIRSSAEIVSIDEPPIMPLEYPLVSRILLRKMS